MSICIATMGKFSGPVPRSWDTGSSGGGGEVKYIDRKLPVIRVNKMNDMINIVINKIEEN